MKSSLKKLVNVIAQPELRRVDTEFNNKHKGESCYIFGDGTSLKWFELGAFPQRPSFILSCLFYRNDFHALQTTYGLLTEPYYFYPYFRLPWPPRTLWRNRIQARYREFIEEYPDRAFFVNLSNYPVLRRRNVYHLFRSIPGSRFCSECAASGEDCFHGSLRAAIVLAIHMGFADIHLVGCDYTHSPARTGHWYEKGEGQMSDFPTYNEEFFRLAARYATLSTITLDGGSKVLPHVTYEQFTGDRPHYRENLELADRRHLQVLSTWPDYRIF